MILRILFLTLVVFVHNAHAKLAPPVDLGDRQILVVDSDTDTVLFAHNADNRMTPSSMTKILTAYLIFEAIESGKISLESRFKVSRKASRVEGTKMYLAEGTTVTVSDLIQGIFVSSGNDACICAAENMVGSEEAFVDLMNQKLEEFGCKHSHFTNTWGMPDPNHYTTCFDLYTMSRRIYEDFPQYKAFFAQKTFVYARGTHRNLNRALYSFNGADGLKTGGSSAGGKGVVISAEVDGQRIFAVINGCRTLLERNRYSDAIMSWAYRSFYQAKLFQKDQTIATLDTWMADKPLLPVTVDKDVMLTLAKQPRANVTAELVFSGPIEAPVKMGDKIGELHVNIEGEDKTLVYPAYAKSDLKKAGYFQRLPIIVYHLIFGQNAK